MTDHWIDEKRVAITAVRRAATVCRQVSQRLIIADTLEKKDHSPVTVADFASQAVVCAHLAEAFPDDAIIAEEDAAELRHASQAAVRDTVVQWVSTGMEQTVDTGQALDWIDLGGRGAKRTGPTPTRCWTLDPIDGTKGFLRGQQYAIALALIEDGQVVLGVLGCPNLSFDGGTGVLLVAARGGGSEAMSLWDESQPARSVLVNPQTDVRQARLCESVESAHSDHGHAAAITKLLGITTEPVRIDSQAKYATVARGEASIYLRLPTRADYREKIWDHAAGMMAVTQAGGCVTDIAGKPLDFTQGHTLAVNRGIVATNGPIHDAVVNAVQKVLA